jgi:hypothetical protein
MRIETPKVLETLMPRPLLPRCSAKLHFVTTSAVDVVKMKNMAYLQMILYPTGTVFTGLCV